MNSTELYIAAGNAIRYYNMSHNKPCVLYMEDGKVYCKPATIDQYPRNNPLYISKFEMERGMEGSRWTSIGTALHNLYRKELACQAHQKH